jgi:hypothetical protein
MLLLGALLALIYGGAVLYESKRDASVADREATTTANVSISFNDPLRPKSERKGVPVCRYVISVSGIHYAGHGPCPSQLILPGVLESLDLQPSPHPATVYYDPSNPETNSLIEYREKGRLDGKRVSLSIGLGVLLGILAIVGFSLSSKQMDSVGVVSDQPQSKVASRAEFLDDLNEVLAKERKEDNLSN